MPSRCRPASKGSVTLIQAMLTPGGRIVWEAMPTKLLQPVMGPQDWGDLLGKIGKSIVDHGKHERPYTAAEQMLSGFVRGLQTPAPNIPSGSA
jgi:hypothetical protein